LLAAAAWVSIAGSAEEACGGAATCFLAFAPETNLEVYPIDLGWWVFSLPSMLILALREIGSAMTFGVSSSFYLSTASIWFGFKTDFVALISSYPSSFP